MFTHLHFEASSLLLKSSFYLKQREFQAFLFLIGFSVAVSYASLLFLNGGEEQN